MDSSNARGLTNAELSQLESLRVFVKSGDATEVKRLLKQKPRLNSEIGGEILWDAVLSDEMEIAKMLVESGAFLYAAKPNDELYSTVLHELVKRNSPRHHQLAMLMIERRGAVITISNRDGLACLEYAIRMRSPVDRISDFLKRRPCVFGKLITDAGRHPDAAELIPLLLAGFVNVETRNRRVVDALFRCSSRRVSESRAMSIVMIILDAKFMSVEEMEKSGFSVRPAVETNKPRLVQLLIKRGFDVNNQAPRGPLPLYAASKLRKSTIAEMLIRAGAEVNALSKFMGMDKKYAIHGACEEMSFENIKLLLRHGANVSALDDSLYTPLALSRFFPYANASLDLPIKRLARNPFSSIDDLGYGNAHRMLIKYIALQAKKGGVVYECDLVRIKAHAGMTAYYDECLNELERMKQRKIIGEVSVFSIFGKGTSELAFETRNCYLLKSYYEAKWEVDFPIFHEEMRSFMRHAVARKESLRDREEALRDSLKINLPYIPLEKIIYYFYLSSTK